MFERVALESSRIAVGSIASGYIGDGRDLTSVASDRGATIDIWQVHRGQIVNAHTSIAGGERPLQVLLSLLFYLAFAECIVR